MNNQDIVAGFKEIFGEQAEQKLNDFKDAVYVNKFEQGRTGGYDVLICAMDNLNIHMDTQKAIIKQVGLELSRERRINYIRGYRWNNLI